MAVLMTVTMALSTSTALQYFLATLQWCRVHCSAVSKKGTSEALHLLSVNKVPIQKPPMLAGLRHARRRQPHMYMLDAPGLRAPASGPAGLQSYDFLSW